MSLTGVSVSARGAQNLPGEAHQGRKRSDASEGHQNQLRNAAALLPGQDKGQGHRHQHFHAKERLPAGGGEPVRPAALHVLLHPPRLQPAAAVPPLQPHHATGLVCHTQLHRPHAGTQVAHAHGHALWRSSLLKTLFFPPTIRLRHFTTTSSSTGLRRTASNRPRRPSPSGITPPGTGIQPPSHMLHSSVRKGHKQSKVAAENAKKCSTH